MFDDNFFPTPAPVIDRMIRPLLQEYGSLRYMPSFQVLEPSAGKGDIVDRLVNVYGANKEQVFCIEQNEELRMILTGKGYRVIDADFLAYADRFAFDLILMNPPFDDGAAHLLKAWEVMRSGRIVCLLNAETIRNPYTKERQVLKTLIDAFGEVEDIGQAFKQAERSTDVEVVIVRLCKETRDELPGFDGSGMEFDGKVNEAEFTANPLAHPNIIQSLVEQYNQAARLTAEIHALGSQYRFYTRGIIDTALEDKKAAPSLNAALTELKAQFWRYIFKKTKIGQATTSQFRQKFETFAEQTAQLAFSEANIMNVLALFFQNHEQIIQECILDVFDKATAYHEKNQVHTEGWKTNKSWKLNKRIIMPNGVVHEPRWDGWSLPWKREDFFKDIDKALCFIAGKKFEDIRGVYAAIEEHLRSIGRGVAYDDVFESEFFRVRVFKKGTVHLDFKDLDLLARFNIAAAEGKGWLGAGY